jgi:hypothetical protein
MTPDHPKGKITDSQVSDMQMELLDRFGWAIENDQLFK